MKQVKLFNSRERGATLVEFALALTVFLTAMFAVMEFGRALWVHNALTDAARRGARYAVLHSAGSADSVKNVVVFGDEAGGTQPIVPNLTVDQVTVTYSDFAVNHGTATVSIQDYQFQFVLPLLGSSITMPNYSTTVPGESIGLVPVNK
jgi:Flp pilus assembly protein TadG